MTPTATGIAAAATAVMVGCCSTVTAPNTVTRVATTTTHGWQRIATAYRHRT